MNCHLFYTQWYIVKPTILFFFNLSILMNKVIPANSRLFLLLGELTFGKTFHQSMIFFSELPVCVYKIYYLTNYRPVQKYILLPSAHLYGNYWLTAVTWRPCIFYTQSVQNITHFEHYDIILRLFLRQVFSRNWNL